MPDNVQDDPLKALTPFEADFVREYRNQGYNATKTYLKLKPDVQENTAKVNGCMLLQRPAVALAVRQPVQSSKTTKDKLILDAERVSGKAEARQQYSAALKGIELQGRFIGAFDSEEQDASVYMQFLSKLQANNMTVNIGCTTNKSEQKELEVLENICEG
jgi:hypothetical protein